MESYYKKSFEILDKLIENKGLLYKLTREELSDALHLSTVLLSEVSVADQVNKMLTVLYESTFTDEITIEEVWEIYCIINYFTFSYVDYKILSGDIRYLYNNIFDSLSKYLDLNLPYKVVDSRNKDIIVIITSQFLSEGHAPTRRVLDYSYAIQKQLNKQVIIINDSGLNFFKNSSMKNLVNLYFMEEYSKINKYKYLDEEFLFYQIDSFSPNINEIKHLINEIYKINPLLVYNIGGSSLLADLCTSFTTTMSLPCSHAIPITRSRYVVVGRKVDERDQKDLERLLDYQEVIESKINYKMSINIEEYKLENFGLSEDKFIITLVGNRLDSEISDEFLSFLNRVVSSLDIYILIIGGVCNKTRIEEGISIKNRLHFAGQLSGAPELVRHTSLYLNPPRIGGGRSSFEALYYGVPVVTLDYGDVYYTAGVDSGVKDYDEMYDRVKMIYENSNLLQNLKEKSIKRAQDLNDIATTQKVLIDEVIRKEMKDIGK